MQTIALSPVSVTTSTLHLGACDSSLTASQNHRIARVGRDLKVHESPILPPEAGPATSTFNTKPGCPGPHPTWPEHLQGWGTHSLSGQAVPAPHHSHSKELLPDIQPKSSLLQLKTISPCAVIIYSFKELTPFLFIGSI